MAGGSGKREIKDLMKKNFELEDLGMSIEKLQKADIDLEKGNKAH